MANKGGAYSYWAFWLGGAGIPVPTLGGAYSYWGFWVGRVGAPVVPTPPGDFDYHFLFESVLSKVYKRRVEFPVSFDVQIELRR